MISTRRGEDHSDSNRALGLIGMIKLAFDDWAEVSVPEYTKTPLSHTCGVAL
jgi:hypothetical protein